MHVSPFPSIILLHELSNPSDYTCHVVLDDATSASVLPVRSGVGWPEGLPVRRLRCGRGDPTAARLSGARSDLSGGRRSPKASRVVFGRIASFGPARSCTRRRRQRPERSSDTLRTSGSGHLRPEAQRRGPPAEGRPRNTEGDGGPNEAAEVRKRTIPSTKTTSPSRHPSIASRIGSTGR
jgi:hypothetical protein